MINRSALSIAGLAILLALAFVLRNRPRSAADLGVDAARSVVVVTAGGSSSRMGTGFVVGPEMVATAYHVVAGADEYKVKTASGATMIAGPLLAYDEDRDLAIVRTPDLGKPALRVRASPLPQQGEAVVVAGHPQGLEFSLSTGIVSSVREFDNTHLLQLTAPVSTGNSGGPVLDRRGGVVGVITASVAGGQNLNFAVQSQHLVPLIDAARRIKRYGVDSSLSMGPVRRRGLRLLEPGIYEVPWEHALAYDMLLLVAPSGDSTIALGGLVYRPDQPWSPAEVLDGGLRIRWQSGLELELIDVSARRSFTGRRVGPPGDTATVSGSLKIPLVDGTYRFIVRDDGREGISTAASGTVFFSEQVSPALVRGAYVIASSFRGGAFGEGGTARLSGISGFSYDYMTVGPLQCRGFSVRAMTLMGDCTGRRPLLRTMHLTKLHPMGSDASMWDVVDSGFSFVTAASIDADSSLVLVAAQGVRHLNDGPGRFRVSKYRLYRRINAGRFQPGESIPAAGQVAIAELLHQHGAVRWVPPRSISVPVGTAWDTLELPSWLGLGPVSAGVAVDGTVLVSGSSGLCRRRTASAAGFCRYALGLRRQGVQAWQRLALPSMEDSAEAVTIIDYPGRRFLVDIEGALGSTLLVVSDSGSVTELPMPEGPAGLNLRIGSLAVAGDTVWVVGRWCLPSETGRQCSARSNAQTAVLNVSSEGEWFEVLGDSTGRLQGASILVSPAERVFLRIRDTVLVGANFTSPRPVAMSVEPQFVVDLPDSGAVAFVSWLGEVQELRLPQDSPIAASPGRRSLITRLREVLGL